MICILKAILGYFILTLAGVNLLGLIVRGLVPSYTKDDNVNLMLVEELKSRASRILTILSILITIAYFYALYHYWNVGVVIAAAMLMLSRIPDLLYEIKTVTKISFKNMPNKFKYVFWNIIGWLALPVLWYAMCKI